ncbi:MAG: L-2-hydroxyglutarate oxidase [Planctomycetaceae bacterium]|nr:L-2-hydroxyglutarate oxidase [Planctomycetaceae bacterium]
MKQYDVIIIGGGIVGLATAWQLQQRAPSLKLAVVEKEGSLAFHQTGRNSGVLHSGIYYRPGSLRAQNCRLGKEALERFCTEHGVAWQQTGKVIVAIREEEFSQLDLILSRGQQNGVRCEMIDRDRLRELEPHCAGLKAIHVPEAGIVDYPGVCEKLGELLQKSGADIHLNCRVDRMEQQTDKVLLHCSSNVFEAREVINCCGLHSDRMARLSGQKLKERIVPFRGEYFELQPDAQHLCRSLIYPVPDPRFPFLGVHFTRMVHGGVECGPNAVFALAREGYNWRTINLRDLWESITYPGFLRLAARNWKTGLNEIWRSLSKAAFVRALQRLVPEIRAEQLTSIPAGVRAQALGLDGKLLDDFLILRHERVINVCNAPSPAATACLNIGRIVAEQVTVS